MIDFNHPSPLRVNLQEPGEQGLVMDARSASRKCLHECADALAVYSRAGTAVSGAAQK